QRPAEHFAAGRLRPASHKCGRENQAGAMELRSSERPLLHVRQCAYGRSRMMAARRSAKPRTENPTRSRCQFHHAARSSAQFAGSESAAHPITCAFMGWLKKRVTTPPATISSNAPRVEPGG